MTLFFQLDGLSLPGNLCRLTTSLLAALIPANTIRQLVPNLNLYFSCTQPRRHHWATCAQPESPFRPHLAQLTPPGNLCPDSISLSAALSPADTTRQLVPRLNLSFGRTQPSQHHEALNFSFGRTQPSQHHEATCAQTRSLFWLATGYKPMFLACFLPGSSSMVCLVYNR